MGIFDRIFGKKKEERPPQIEKREVDFEGLEKLISEIEESELRAMEEKGNIIGKSVKETVSTFKDGLAVLSDAQLTKEHKERDRRTYEIVRGSKERIMSQFPKAVEMIKIPEKMDRSGLVELNSSLTEFSNMISRNSKNLLYASTSFGAQMKNIKEALKMLDGNQKEILNCLDSDSFRVLEEIKEKTAESKELRELNRRLIEKEGEIKKLMETEEKKKSEAERELKKYRSSKEYEEYEKTLLHMNEVEKEMEREEVRIRSSISPLMKMLRSLKRIESDKQKSKLIEDYTENSMEAITKEEGLAGFKEILSDLDTAIREKKIKVHSEADIRKRLDEIGKTDMLSISVAKYAKLKAEIKKLKGTEFGVLKLIKDAESVLRQDSRERLEKELSETRQKMERGRESMGERKEQIETLLSKAGHDIILK